MEMTEMSYEDFRKNVEPNYDHHGNWIGPNYPPLYHQRGEGAVREGAAIARPQPEPAWWTNRDELLNGPKTAPSKSRPGLKGGSLPKRDKKPAWYSNFLDTTGQGPGYA